MASVAESSVASVPLSKLAELQQKLLQQSEANEDARANGDQHSANTNNTEAFAAESANAYTTPKSSSKAPPRLSGSKSASAVEMDAMIQPSPSQEAFKAMTRANSFHGYAGGDTQPMESQVYRDYTESMVQPTRTTPKKTVVNVHISPEGKATYDMLATDKTPHTCVEGDTDYVDLGFQSQSPAAQSSSSYADGFLRDTQTYSQAESAPRQHPPETPSAAGHKHGRDGEILTSAVTTNKKTPGLTQLFGGAANGPMMSGTQLFNQTQAPSSPMVGAPRSDPIDARPSPNLQNQYSASSPIMPASSPVAPMHNKLLASTGEPRDNYTSMRESQEKRAAKLRQELGLDRRLSRDDLDVEDEENDIEQRRFRQKRMQRVMSDQALHECAKVRAPSRPGSRTASSPKRVPTIDLVTPAADKKIDPEEFNDSEGENEMDADVIEDEQVTDDQESNDEFDELGQTVLRSQSNGEELGEDDESATGGLETEDENEDDSHEKPTNLEPSQEDEQRGEGQQTEQPRSGTQRSAVADSQPLQDVGARSRLPQGGNESSSVQSYVPASQYAAAKTSQDDANATDKSSSAHMVSVEHAENRRVPSSPPLAPANDELPDTQAFDASEQPDHSSVKELEVPESDLPAPDGTTQASNKGADADANLERESIPNAPYSTARTHVTASGQSPRKNDHFASPLKVFASQQNQGASQSPRTAAGVRHFADIITSGSPPNGSGESQVDIDAIMSDVVTADDKQFMADISTPPQERASKRRKIANTKSKDSVSAPRHVEAKAFGVTSRGQKKAIQQSGDDATHDGETGAQSHALRDSPSKANELRSGPPAEEEVPESTSGSAKQREEAGAKAASELLSKRSTRTAKPTAKRSQTKRAPPASRKKVVRDIETSDATNAEDPAIQDTNDLDDARSGLDGNQTTSLEEDDGAERTEEPAMPSNASNRVFALFKGSFNNFYPATWLGPSPDGQKHRVKFDDETVTPIETHHVRRLELRLGDAIKVDVPGMRNKTWIVKGFGPVASSAEERAAGTDSHGRFKVQVQAKSTRTSAATNDGGKEDESVDVAVTAIYLTHTMWPHFTDRTFQPPSSTVVSSRAATPSNDAQTPDVEMSGSRSRRSIIPTAKAMGPGRTSHLHEEAAVSSSPPSTTGLFSGMAFAISYGSNEAEKADVTRLIVRNGGVILEKGFDELFNLPNLEEAVATSPAKKPARKDADAEVEATALELKPGYVDFGFVALIADRHSRRAKYVQALSLGLPTLSGRWIADSLDSSKNLNFTGKDAAPLSWTNYLLPAGESTYLGGAIRSRTMSIYNAASAKLATTIESRDILLNGDGVLIVVPKKGKSTWERRKAYAFLTIALGAGRVKRVSDLLEATAFTSEDPDKWKWIYVDGSVAEASAVVFGKGNGAGKKRKRDEQVVKVDAKAMSAGDGQVKIVNDEFVVQSLILGALVD